ncbi:MAG: ATP-binding cassette domain-containing protein [Candidatus Fimenecus sp.]|nr:ATP-binding cassette domain-containing protein [Candidatus Fimenecus sp.]
MTEIAIQNLSKTIKSNAVIQDISMNLKSGVIYGFKGINGSGKTMLMRLICGLIRPTEGEIRINGKTLGKDLSFPESIGVFLENPAFLDSYSGFQNLKILASIKSVATDEDIRATLSRVGLSPNDKKKYRKYSLGMKQRLGIAAAIMEKPDIVILDEPTNSLDADGVMLVKQIVQEEKVRGALVILSCHDGALLEGLSDEIFLLERWRLTEHTVGDEV